MNVWKKTVPFERREFYYSDTTKEFKVAKLAARLHTVIQEELERQNEGEVLFLYIGTDRLTGDSLGSLTGHKLWEKHLNSARVLGTLDRPVHVMNLGERLWVLENHCPHHLVVTVDVLVGRTDHVGCITLGHGALEPGLSVNKRLRSMSGTFVTGAVNSCSSYDPLMLQSICPSVVACLVDCISEGIYLVGKLQDFMALV